MQSLRLGVLGFGNVNRALVQLLQKKTTELCERHGIAWSVTGVASRRMGWQANTEGFDSIEILRVQRSSEFTAMRGHACNTYGEWLDAARPDVVFEATSLNVENGQPAIEHIRAALEHGAHAITANKGPIVHAYEELLQVATQRDQQFLFESTVMDGAPIFFMFS